MSFFSVFIKLITFYYYNYNYSFFHFYIIIPFLRFHLLLKS